MDLRPFNVKNHRVKHAIFATATAASMSITAPGTGLGFIPVYWYAITSGVASFAVTNGTSGTSFFTVKTVAGQVAAADYWEDTFLSNKPLVIESTLNGAGVTDFHVWFVIRRLGAGNDGLGV